MDANLKMLSCFHQHNLCLAWVQLQLSVVHPLADLVQALDDCGGSGVVMWDAGKGELCICMLLAFESMSSYQFT